VHCFWPVEESAELAEGSSGCGEVVSGVCLFAWNFGVARSLVLTGAERKTTPKMTLSLD
jgi:hypothetical protein